MLSGAYTLLFPSIKMGTKEQGCPQATINTSIIKAIGMFGKVGHNVKTLLLDVFKLSLAANDNVFLGLMMHLHVIFSAYYCTEFSPDAI